MGWKNFKEGYKIEHQVRVTSEGICIGSSYIPDIIVVGLDGKIKKRYADRGNEDLCRYMAEIDADPEKLLRLITTPDTFTANVVVYTYEGGNIREALCETPGWPNVTHAGEMMYENSFSTNKADVVRWAKRNCEASIQFMRDDIQRAKDAIAAREAELAKFLEDNAKLVAEFPDEED